MQRKPSRFVRYTLLGTFPYQIINTFKPSLLKMISRLGLNSNITVSPFDVVDIADKSVDLFSIRTKIYTFLYAVVLLVNVSKTREAKVHKIATSPIKMLGIKPSGY